MTQRQQENEINVPKRDEKSNDVINHPKHYTSGAIECWDYIVSQGLGFLEGNVIKYVTRYRHKNGREDLLKAKAYLDRLLKEIP